MKLSLQDSNCLLSKFAATWQRDGLRQATTSGIERREGERLDSFLHIFAALDLKLTGRPRMQMDADRPAAHRRRDAPLPSGGLMTISSLLARGRAAPVHVSAVDAVMGEDWGEITFRGGGAMRASLMAAHREDIAPGGKPMPPCVPGRSAQAVVKMVRTGGARNVAGLKAQMTYLARQGGV
ncbi:hypothetical protein L1787_18090, partial [Acuticoccus sp. M5D2P5]|uniref:hypothetical protein n=1 Tax=Acuticoccus kalidii TaxID=2910977 RepID=UPI001F15754C